MDIQFKIDPERLTLNDLMVMEDFGAATWRERREMLANNMTDADGNFLETGKAREILSKMTLAQIADVSNAFTAAVKELTGKQLPPRSGSA